MYQQGSVKYWLNIGQISHEAENENQYLTDV